VPSPQPLIPDTDITGVLATSHLYADDDFDTLRDENGTVELQLVTVTPMTSAEVDLFDIRRSSAV
jgi:hypothetical protein